MLKFSNHRYWLMISNNIQFDYEIIFLVVCIKLERENIALVLNQCFC